MHSLALLYPFIATERNIHINDNEFVIGRAKNASYDIKDLEISRTHCLLRLSDTWTLCDKSSGGTWLNGKRVKAHEEVPLKDGDRINLSQKYTYIFCNGGQDCSRSCKTRAAAAKSGLDAEMAQRRRLFEHKASLQKDGIEKSILEKQQDRYKLEQQQDLLQQHFNQQILNLEERNRRLHDDLTRKGNGSECNLLEEKEYLEKQLRDEKKLLQDRYFKETSELASKISVFEAAEVELKSQNKALLERLECEKQQFELRLEEERKILEAKLAEQVAEQQKLVAEKAEIEEALRLRIQNLEKVAHQEEEEQQQRQVEREKEEERLSKEKVEFEKRLEELQKLLEEKERQERERERELEERDRELRAQEEQRERERKEEEERREAEFLAREKELEDIERARQLEHNRHKEEVTIELKRQAEEREKELQLQRVREQERLKKELEEKEEEMRKKLELEMLKLQEEKVSIEMSIRGELSKKEGESAENIQKLTAELEQVKRDLNTTSTKKSLLEKELDEASRDKEAASQSGLQAKKDVIENFGELMESELQCSICNELFVCATTLNCNHTFCSLCIGNWLSKKRDCPICRAPSTQQSRSLVLDNFIDRMVENLSEDLKRRRKEIVDERKGVESHAERNPSKKRKVVPVSAPNALPLQMVNNNVIAGPARGPARGGPTVIVPVSSIPSGAPVIHIPSSTVAALNRGFQFVTAQSTSQVPQLQQQQVSHILLQHRQQLLQQQRPQLAPQSSSAPNRTTTQMNPVMTPITLNQIRQQGIRTRGGAAPRPVPGTQRMTYQVCHAPRTVPSMVVRAPTPTILRNAAPPRQAAPPRVSSPHIRAQIRQPRP